MGSKENLPCSDNEEEYRKFCQKMAKKITPSFTSKSMTEEELDKWMEIISKMNI